MKQATDRRTDPGRRRFLQGRFLTRAGREEVRRQVLGPPPPALATGLIPDNPCEYCGHPCVAACEADIIRLHPDDHVYRGMPYLSFEAAGCTFCDACVEACLLPPEDLAGEPRGVLGTALLDHSACMAWNGVICMSCQFACGHRAIRADARGQPSVDTDRCNGCGACVGICPAHAVVVEPLQPYG